MSLASWLSGKVSKRKTPEDDEPFSSGVSPKKFKKHLNQNSFDWYIVDDKGKWHCSICRAVKSDNAYARGHDQPAKTTNHRRHATSDIHLNAILKTSKAQTPIKQIIYDKLTKDDENIINYLKLAYYIAERELPKEEFPFLINLFSSLGVETISGSNYTYTSDKSVSNFQECIAEVILEQKISEIKQSDLFSIIIDESTDKANSKTLLVYIQYFYEGLVKTCLLENIEILTESADAETIVSEITTKFKVYGLDVYKLIGVGSDGASVMTGSKSGVVVRLRDFNKSLIGVHCAAHRISLACSQAARDIDDMVRFNKTVSNIFSFFTSSALRHNKLREIQELLQTPKLKYTPIHSVRWLSLHRAVECIYRTYPALVYTLEHEAAQNNLSAQNLLDEVKQFKFIALLHLLMDILPFLTKLSKLFQYETIDFSKIRPAVSSACEALSDIKNYDGAFIEKLDFFIVDNCYTRPISDSAKNNIKDDVNLNMEGFTGYECGTVKQNKYDGETQPVELKYCAQQKQRFEKVKNNYIANIIDNLNSRFQDVSVLENMYVLIPQNIVTAYESDKESIAKYGKNEFEMITAHYADYIECDISGQEFTQYKRLVIGNYPKKSLHEISKIVFDKYLDLLPNIFVLLKLACLIPVSSATCERGFSTQNRIKTRLRTNLSNKTLNDLMRISEDGGPRDDFDFKKALLKWKGQKPRKLFAM